VAAWLRSAAQVQTAEPLIIDASALQQFNTATLAVLLEAGRLAQQHGRVLQINSAPPALQELAQLYGVTELLHLGASSENRAKAPS
jgi:ABC-type transporter Mla MlaB component